MENEVQSRYPRPFTSREREWIDWILPADRRGYAAFRRRIDSMTVIGPGRRGEGEVILGTPGALPDIESPLPAVFAYGVIETSFGSISVTIREVQDDQVSLEIVSQRSENVPHDFEEARRWTYSTWDPGQPCPQCLNAVRQVSMHAESGDAFVLALCPHDKRIWVFSSASNVNRLIPVTNYYNELMLHKNIRDPKIALDSRRLFTDLRRYSDSDLAYAFGTYNAMRTKVQVDGIIESDRKEPRSLRQRLTRLFKK